MNDGADPLNLTGVWHGNYTYPLGFKSVSFVATLLEAGRHVSGSTYEPHSFRSEMLYASLSGSRDCTTVEFTKTCQNGGEEYQWSIEYEGRLNEDGTEIEGTWTIPNQWSGKFLMIRSGRQAIAVSQKKFEKA